MKERNHASAVLEIDGIIIPVQPNAEHEWTLSTEHVAVGYEISPGTLRRHKQAHGDELVEGTHWISVQNLNANPRGGIPHVETRWTRLGVITLGFFIKSERAKRFRRMAAELICRLQEAEEAGDVLSAAQVEAVIRDLAAMVSRSLDVVTRSVEIMAQTQQMMAMQNQHLVKRLDSMEKRMIRLDQRLDPLSEAFFSSRSGVAVQVYERWMQFAVEVATNHVLRGQTQVFSAMDLHDLGAPVVGSSPRPHITIGRMMSRLSGKTLELDDGTTALFHAHRTNSRRVWHCTRTAQLVRGRATDAGSERFDTRSGTLHGDS